MAELKLETHLPDSRSVSLSAMPCRKEMHATAREEMLFLFYKKERIN